MSLKGVPIKIIVTVSRIINDYSFHNIYCSGTNIFDYPFATFLNQRIDEIIIKGKLL